MSDSVLNENSRAKVSPGFMTHGLKEYEILNEILSRFSSLLNLEELGTVSLMSRSLNGLEEEKQFPIPMISLGSTDPLAPVVFFTGAIHGLERIGAQVILSYMSTLLESLLWDKQTQDLLTHIRVVFIPVVNPIGVYRHSRSNGNGVDLMRNAPVEAEVAPFLVGGHRISRALPWYRGKNGLELENQFVINAIRSQTFESKRVISLDVHSGFGLNDQIWLPFAKTHQAFDLSAETHALFSVFNQSHPHHFYRIEPQSKNYTTHGDLWDYIFEIHPQKQGPYLPLCLELGSWMWVRKNPLQIFSREGLFHPRKAHRQKRVLRRHHTFFDFLLRAARSGEFWSELNPEQRIKHEDRAKELWYGR